MLVMLFLLVFSAQRLGAEHVKVILLAGQSNMDGRAENFPVNFSDPLNSVPFYTSKKILTVVQTQTSGTNETGPEVSLGYELDSLFPDQKIALIKYARGGTNLFSQWKAGGNGQISGDGPEYVRFQDVVTSGFSALQSSYPNDTFEVVAILWTQGESDAVNNRTTTQYQTDLTTFIADVRATYGSNLPFLFSRLSNNQTRITSAQRNAIRTAQNNVNSSVSNVYLIDTDSFSVLSDNLHFDSTGQISLGQSYASAIGATGVLNASVISIGPLGRGIAGTDNRSGTGYLMYSEDSVHTRFAANPPHPFNADHVIAVTYENNTWKYDTNTTLVAFTPQLTDLLIATVDFSADTATTLQGSSGSVQGIERGYQIGDLTFHANLWNNNPSSNGEFGIIGTYFLPNRQQITVQAEDYTTQSGTVLKNNSPGFTGSGFMDYGGIDTYLEWRNIETTSGNWVLAFRYANGGGGKRKCNVIVNGSVSASVDFPATGSWATWQTVFVTVPLAGSSSNKIRLQAATNAGGPNLDRLTIE